MYTISHSTRIGTTENLTLEIMKCLQKAARLSKGQDKKKTSLSVLRTCAWHQSNMHVKE